MDTHVYWTLLEQPGLEHLHLTVTDDGILADGLVLGSEEAVPFRLWYQVRAERDWTVRECAFQAAGPPGPPVRYTSDGQGRWTDAAGNHVPALDGCLDVDIAVTPFTNTLPIQRLTLAPGERAEVLVAYVTVPDLGVRPVRQRYTCLSRGVSGGVYRFEGLESGFRADLEVDGDGLVVEYPSLWRRLWMR